LLLPLLAGLAVASSAAAQSPRAGTAVLCLDTSGASRAAACHSTSASRLRAPDNCYCRGAVRTVRADWCEKGERQAPESRSMARERLAYAIANNNSVVGFTYQGRRSCVLIGGRRR